MKIKFTAVHLLLCIITVTGLALRLYKLSEVPSGFFADEAANGFNAYKLLTTGKDEYGVTFPFYFRSFGDYRNPVTIYSMMPVIGFLGLSEFSVRLSMAIFGTATIALLFLLCQELFWKAGRPVRNSTGLVASLFLAISPWHIHLSRTGFEFITLPFFLTLSLYFFFRFLHQSEEKGGKDHDLIVSSIFFLVTFYTYYPIQLVLPPLLLGLVLLFGRSIVLKSSRRSLTISLIIFLVGLIPFFLGINNGEALTRFRSVSPIASGRNLLDLAPKFWSTYKDHFSLDFLFTKGDAGMPGHSIDRHSVRGIGELYLFQLPLLLIGLLGIFRFDLKIFIFFILWLALYPIGSTVVGEGPFSHRSIFGLIPLQILSAYGAATTFHLFDALTHKVRLVNLPIRVFLLSSFISLSIIGLSAYSFKYFVEYPSYSADFYGWQYGPREIMKYFLSAKDGYDDLYMSGEFNGAEIFFKFYDPENTCRGRCKGGDFLREPSIVNRTRRQLFSLSPEYLSNSGEEKEFIIRRKIYYPNGKVAFLIGELRQFMVPLQP